MVYASRTAWDRALRHAIDPGIIALEGMEYVFPQLGLPNVLLIGDSISVYYTPFVRKALAGKANVFRIPDNGGNTDYGLKKLDYWLDGFHWDIIHFNWGLHDLLIRDGRPVHTVDEYEANLARLTEMLKKTGARLIWASTTPVPEGAGARPKGSEAAYNQRAKQIMEINGIEINDLHLYIWPFLQEAQQPRDVHFTARGSEILGKKVVEALGGTK